jgi:CTP synthase (UTP-ammonia lyase)
LVNKAILARSSSGSSCSERQIGELKTKPTQHSVKELRSIGIQPDILICRSEHELPEEERAKIALFTNVASDSVFTSLGAANLNQGNLCTLCTCLC